MSPRTSDWEEIPTVPEGHVTDEQLLREYRQRAQTAPEYEADGE